MNVSHPVTDLSRAVARVDANASADPMDTPPGEQLSFGEMLTAVARGLAYQLERAGLSFRNVSDEAVVVTLAAHGMSPFGLAEWSADIADRLRHDFSHGKWSSETPATVAAESRRIGDVDTQPFTPDDYARGYVCVAPGRPCSPHLTVKSNGVWFKGEAGSMWQSAHAACLNPDKEK